MQERLVDFSEIEQENLTGVASDSTLQLNFKELQLGFPKILKIIPIFSAVFFWKPQIFKVKISYLW